LLEDLLLAAFLAGAFFAGINSSPLPFYKCAFLHAGSSFAIYEPGCQPKVESFCISAVRENRAAKFAVRRIGQMQCL
jgi:hypothetical protein